MLITSGSERVKEIFLQGLKMTGKSLTYLF